MPLPSPLEAELHVDECFLILLACERPTRKSYDSHDLTLEIGGQSGARLLLDSVRHDVTRLILVSGKHDRELNAAVLEAWPDQKLDTVYTGADRSEVSGLERALRSSATGGRGLVLSGRNRYTLPVWAGMFKTVATIWPSAAEDDEQPVCGLALPDVRAAVPYVEAEQDAARQEKRPESLTRIVRAMAGAAPSKRLACESYTDISTDESVEFLLEDDRRARKARRAGY